MTFAGFPPTTVLGGTSFVTTAPDAITEFSPTETPGNTTAFPPIHTLFPILISYPNSNCSFHIVGSIG